MTTTYQHTTSGPIDAIATFTASRSDLFGSHALVGSAELARAVCRGAQRSISVFAVTSERMRRIDGWLDHHGFVTHAAAATDSDAVVGSLSDRAGAHDILTRLVHAMVGDCPAQPADRRFEHDLSRLGPSTMPPDADWFVLVLAANGANRPFTSGIAANASGNRLAVAEFTSIGASAEFVGASANDWRALLASMVAATKPSFSEALREPRTTDRGRRGLERRG